ncbi:MAG: glucokinase [Asticcacaulis sp.]
MFRPSNVLIGLVGDVGGTNARFAIARIYGDDTELEHCHSLSCARYDDFYAALDAYFAKVGEVPRLDFAILAVAGPVREGEIRFTNLDWVVRESALRHKTGAVVVKLINGLCRPGLRPAAPAQRRYPYHRASHDGYGDVYAVMGAGTGFGASVLIDSPHGAVCLSTESGHVAFSPVGDLELAVDCALRRRFGRVTVEMLLSGGGLVNLYQAIRAVRGEAARDLTAAEITDLDGEAGCRDTVMTFWDIMAGVAGDFVLSHGATAGVFIAGGIAPKLMKHLDEARFRRRMEDKPPMSAMVHGVPARLITHAYPALIGAANALSHQEMLAVSRPEMAQPHIHVS